MGYVVGGANRPCMAKETVWPTWIICEKGVDIVTVWVANNPEQEIDELAILEVMP